MIFRIVFMVEADQWFGRNLGNRNGAAPGERMLRGDGHTNAFVKQLFISQVAQRTSLRSKNDQSELNPAVATPSRISLWLQSCNLTPNE
jgi:hypothetical protein